MNLGCPHKTSHKTVAMPEALNQNDAWPMENMAGKLHGGLKEGKVIYKFRSFHCHV
jgi:hypothetical protein